MAIKKQKRSLEESVPAVGEKPKNGSGQKNKPEKHMKKIKLEKESESSARAAGSPPKKIKLEKQSHPAPKAAGGPVKIKTEGAHDAALSKNAKRQAKFVIKKENRREARKEHGQFKVDQVNMSKEEIELRIKEITSRGELSKSAKRKLSVFKKKLALLEGTYKPHVPEVSKKVGSPKKEKKIKLEIEKQVNGGGAQDSQKKNILIKPSATASGQTKSGKNKAQKDGNNKKKAIVQVKTEESDEEEENEEEDSEEEMDQSQSEASNASTEEEEDEEEEEEGEDDEEDEDDDEENEDDEEEEKKEEITTKPAALVKNIKKEPKSESPVKKQGRPQASSDGGKKKRFVLFVGNLSYQASEHDIRNHFLTKVSAVESVRIPTKQGTNEPRGFAYVELTNEADYQKALSLHDSTINGRKLNIQYTQPGSKTVHHRSEVVAKNKKLHALRKGGMFGRKQDNRNERRKKQQTSN